jgi:type 1 glutamine amidotransferase
MKGLPPAWVHDTEEELYDQMRGPAENVTVLAAAHSDAGTRGSGEYEPLLMAIDYGEGRVFHTTLGHNVETMSGVSFKTTFLRGVEWAATGQVTQEVPANFPAAVSTP